MVCYMHIIMQFAMAKVHLALLSDMRHAQCKNRYPVISLSLQELRKMEKIHIQ